MRTSSEYIDKINQVLAEKHAADVYIMNDKLTLSVFTALEKIFAMYERYIFLSVRVAIYPMTKCLMLLK